MTETSYQRAARLKFPGYGISGDGPYAIVCAVTQTVHLYDFWLLAMNDLAVDHSNWRCKDSHKLIELKPAPILTQVILRNPAEAFRD